MFMFSLIMGIIGIGNSLRSPKLMEVFNDPELYDAYGKPNFEYNKLESQLVINLFGKSTIPFHILARFSIF